MRALSALCVLLATGLCLPAAHADDAYRLLKIDNHYVKWGQPEFGSGTSLSYALLDGTSTFSGLINCRDVGAIDPLLTHANLTRDTVARELRAALAMWESVANVHFREAKDAASADIIIGAETRPEGIAYADIAGRSGAVAGQVESIGKGIVCLNPERSWHIDSAESAMPVAVTPDTVSYNLRYTFAHEIGHVLGLDHASSHGELMGYVYDSANRGLKSGDIAGAVALYGAAPQMPSAREASVRLISGSADPQR